MVNIISKKEEGAFLSLFNRNGYVLDFTTNEFDVFTTNSIGVALCSKYQSSKGKSLVAYLNQANDNDRTTLLKDLFQYYEDKMEYEYNPEYEDFSNWSFSSRYNETYAKIYEKCREIIVKLEGNNANIEKSAESLKESFSSDYLSKQIDIMVDMQTKNPTEAIGKAKELIESCCKTILDELKIEWDKNEDIIKLTNKVMNELQLLPSNIQDNNPGADAIKALLGNMRAIPTKLSELRNPYGSEHGKTASYQGLEIRHAKLAVGCSITFVQFVWDTYENMVKNVDKNEIDSLEFL